MFLEVTYAFLCVRFMGVDIPIDHVNGPILITFSLYVQNFQAF